MKRPTSAPAVLPTLLVAIALLLAAPMTAQAGVGFGYDDPRSMQINAGSFDLAADGDVLFVDQSVVYELSEAGITPIAGGGRKQPTTTPMPATDANLGSAIRIAATPDGGFLIGTFVPAQILRVTPAGTIFVAAGNGQSGAPQPGPATESPLGAPSGIAATGPEGFLIGDLFSARVHEVSEDGTLATIAGGGGSGYSGDGGPATAARVNAPIAVEPTADGGVLIGDMGNHRIREISPGGTITTVAGTGEPGYNGDGIPATTAQISGPSNFAQITGPLDIEATADGGFFFVDSGNRRVRRVGPGGMIETVAGTGRGGYNGDGIAATSARMSPREIALTDDGGFLVLDRKRIRKVSPDGEITTIAGMPKATICRAAPYSGFQGTAAADRIEGGPLRDLIRGEGGADTLIGAGQADCLIGGTADDVLLGNGNADSLVGEPGNDQLEGLDGPDHIVGSRGNDEVLGDDGPDRLDGGRDQDRISGGSGRDRITSNGDSAPDRVRCGPGRDTVRADQLDRVSPSCEKVTFSRR